MSADQPKRLSRHVQRASAHIRDWLDGWYCPDCAQMSRAEIEKAYHAALTTIAVSGLGRHSFHPTPEADHLDHNPDEEVCADCHHQRRRHWSGTGPNGYCCQDCVCDGFKR